MPLPPAGIKQAPRSRPHRHARRSGRAPATQRTPEMRRAVNLNRGGNVREIISQLLFLIRPPAHARPPARAAPAPGALPALLSQLTFGRLSAAPPPTWSRLAPLPRLCCSAAGLTPPASLRHPLRHSLHQLSDHLLQHSLHHSLHHSLRHSLRPRLARAGETTTARDSSQRHESAALCVTLARQMANTEPALCSRAHQRGQSSWWLSHARRVSRTSGEQCALTPSSSLHGVFKNLQ